MLVAWGVVVTGQMIIPGYFEKIFSEDCNLSNPKIEGSRIIICVRNIGVIRGHPLHQEGGPAGVKYFSSGHLIFEGVEASMRELSEYAVKPNVNQFKSKRVIQDGPFPRVEGNKETFRFMGVLDSPRAWTDWTVLAAKFSLEVPSITES